MIKNVDLEFHDVKKSLPDTKDNEYIYFILVGSELISVGLWSPYNKEFILNGYRRSDVKYWAYARKINFDEIEVKVRYMNIYKTKEGKYYAGNLHLSIEEAAEAKTSDEFISTQTIYIRDKTDIKCPFCTESISQSKPNGVWCLKCINEKCTMKPSLCACGSYEEIIKVWKTLGKDLV